MHRLRMRGVICEESTRNHTRWDHLHIGLTIVMIYMKLFNRVTIKFLLKINNEGESSEAGDYDDRLMGILGL